MIRFVLLGFITAGLMAPAADSTKPSSNIERGRYVIAIAGCNDCHTDGYAQTGGKVPQEQLLTGSVVGFSGPWGTTYPTNLRLMLSELSEAEWLVQARQSARPPMPSISLHAMTDADLQAIYAYITSLGPAGAKEPSYVPPSGEVTTPYFDFVPKNLPAH